LSRLAQIDQDTDRNQREAKSLSSQLNVLKLDIAALGKQIESLTQEKSQLQQ
jgi:phage shock protein A